jgi:hypothetical protein
MTTEKNNEQNPKYPGYPHYPAKEDIMNSKDNERLDVDVENLSRSNSATSSAIPDKSIKSPRKEDDSALTDVDADELTDTASTEANLTADDLIALGAEEAPYGKTDDVAGEDLDVPGSEADDQNEEIGEEDEENNYYSLGGDAHEE